MTTRRALIIGGGIGGPVTAMALQKAGIAATVFEAHPHGAEGVGVMLTVATNGIDALHTLGAEHAALDAGFATPGITLVSGTGKRLGTTRTGGSRPAAPQSRTIKRADLYRALHDEAAARGVAIEFGKRLVHAETSPEGVRAVFADGTDAHGDVLIGCDGIHSTVRRLIDANAPAPSYTGLITTGGFCRGIAVDTPPGDYEMIFGKRAFFGYCRPDDDETWWFVNVPRRPEPERGEVEAVSTAEWRARMLDLFSDDAGPATRLIEATADFAPMSPIHTVPRLPTWHRDRMIVTGDAAHAPSPTSGQGASLAVEDAVVLATCLRDLPDPANAFAAFESRRRRRVERIVAAAARINNSKAAGPVGRVLRDLMLPRILTMTANTKSQNETFDHHIDWDAPITAGVHADAGPRRSKPGGMRAPLEM